MVWRHKKTQGLYDVIGSARMQTNDCPALDMEVVVVYKSRQDNSVWVRPYYEFHDGRFEEINE